MYLFGFWKIFLNILYQVTCGLFYASTQALYVIVKVLPRVCPKNTTGGGAAQGKAK